MPRGVFAFVTSGMPCVRSRARVTPTRGLGFAGQSSGPAAGPLSASWSDRDGEVGDVSAARVAGDGGELVDAAVVTEDHVAGE